LIRPRLDQHLVQGTARPSARRRPQPPDQTGLETAFYARQSSASAIVAVTLEDGQVLRGVVEWNDRDCLSLKRKDLPSIVVMKHVIVHVAPDEGAARRV
jgi:sRNA-binding regulator protein Hfq